MSAETGSAKVEEGGVALPQGRVLSYLGVANTPTRVRELAAKALKWGGLGSCALSLIPVGVIGWMAWEFVRTTGMPVAEVLYYHPGEIAALFVLFVIAAACGIVMVACAGFVRRGKAAPCILAGTTLIPLWLLSFGATMIFALAAAGSAVDSRSTRDTLLSLLLLIPSAVALLLVMLMFDMWGFLWWIVKNPVTEKPAVAFLPKGN